MRYPSSMALFPNSFSPTHAAASPGEFTLRAFMAGRMDLAQAEAVLGVIDADGDAALDNALRQLAGNLSLPLHETRSTLLDLLADVEAGLDFADEDIEFISADQLDQRLTQCGDQVNRSIERLRTGRVRSEQRPVITLRGYPNAGKSQLMNRLCGQPAAIVSQVAGTTRDVVSVDTTVRSHRVTLRDTAGIENRQTLIHQKSNQQTVRNDRDALVIRIWCVDGSQPDAAQTMEKVEQIAAESAVGQSQNLFAKTKSDLYEGAKLERLTPENTNLDGWLRCSGIVGRWDRIVARRHRRRTFGRR